MAVHDQGAVRKRTTIADLDGRTFARVSEVADLFEVDQRTIRSQIVAGEIPASRMGSEYRIPVRWILQQAGAAAAA
jgi:excisionase family DNA binding protein